MNKSAVAANAAILVCTLSVGQYAIADQREFAEDIAGALCGAVGASEGGNVAAAAGTVVCKYATRLSDSIVKALIDKYFDGKDQSFVDATCSTLQYADGRILKPSTQSGCNK